MKLNTHLPDVQTSQYKNWHIIHTPALSLEWIHDLLNHDLSLIKKHDPDLLKTSPLSLLLRRTSDIGPLLGKLYRKPSVKQLLRSSIGQNQASNSWSYAQQLLSHGIATPEPLAYLEQRVMGVCPRAWYICRFEEGINCDSYFLHSPTFTPAMRNMVFSIVELFVNLQENQFTHGNLKASKLLISNNKPLILGLENMQYHSDYQKAKRLWQQEIIMFMESWRERFDIDKQFRLAFSKRNIQF